MVPYEDWQALEQLLAVDAGEVAQRQAAELSKYAPSPLKTIILFGGAWLGKKTLANLQALQRGYQIYFCDNNPKVTGEILGIPVLPKAEAIKQFGASALFVVTIYNGASVVEELKEAGCQYVVPYVVLYRAFAKEFMPLFSLSTPEPIAQNAESIEEVFELLADDQSRGELLKLFDWYLSPEFYPLSRPIDPKETYYPPDLMRPIATERFVDCGAYDGDSLKAFYEKWNGKFEKIAAFEPVADNLARIAAFRKTIPADFDARLDVFPYALGNERGTVTFAVDEFSSSHLGHDAARHEQQHQVQMVKLDDELHGFHPSYIKMDIEGAEPFALEGAAEILRNDAPILAICLYHDIRHLWEIPLLIHRLNPEYKLYIRRYSQDCWETVCYAIPPGRAI